MSDLIKQPNGKFCKIGLSGMLLLMNYTEDDIIEMYVEEAKRRAERDMEEAMHYGRIIKEIESKERHHKERYIHDSDLETMGFEKTYEELVKFLPRKPLEQQYIHNAFTTYGKCPNCGANVQNCFGPPQGKCRDCDQVLDWS